MKKMLWAGLLSLLVSGCGSDTRVYDEISAHDKIPDSAAFEKRPHYALVSPETAPEDRYVLLDNARGVALVYYAYAVRLDDLKPADYNLIAQSVSREYRYAVDGFQKNDLLANLIPEIKSGLDRFSRNRFYAIDIPVLIGHYDFTNKTFPTKGVPQKNFGVYFQGNDLAVSFLNPDDFASVVVEQEDKARHIEALVSNNHNQVVARFYLFMQHSDTENRRANFTVTRMRITGPDGAMLLDASV